jgi:hypothetical protein
MENQILPKDYNLEIINSNSIKKHRKKLETSSKNKKKPQKFHSNKNNLIEIRHFDKLEKIPKNNECQSHNLKILGPNYKKDLFEKFSEFLDKKKFKLSNNFDAKNSKKFLDKKDKCLERIILSDIIENDDNNDNTEATDNEDKFKFKTQKQINKYIIVVSNYDDEVKNKNNRKKRSVNYTRTYKD